MPYYIIHRSFFLAHHGILGQKWGVRRYQNKDGTLTAAGRKRQQKEATRDLKNVKKTYKVKENGKKLREEYKNVLNAEFGLFKHRNDYFKNNPPDSKKFKEDVEKGLKFYISDDDEDLREYARAELDQYIKEGRDVRNTMAGEQAYHIAQMSDPSYDKLYSDFLKSTDNYSKAAKDLATKAYDSAGADVMKKWGSYGEDLYKNTRENDIDMIAYFYDQEAKKSKKR